WGVGRWRVRSFQLGQCEPLQRHFGATVTLPSWRQRAWSHSRRSGTRQQDRRHAPSLVQIAHVGGFSKRAWRVLGPTVFVRSAGILVYLSVLLAVSVTVRLAPLPTLTRAPTQAVGWLTCIRPAGVSGRAAPGGSEQVT